jgi:hypothetical protein
MFESGSFTVYAEWKPEGSQKNNQQIIGHYSWELWQDRSKVEFRVGRMNDANGTFYTLSSRVNQSFFNDSHSVLAVYHSNNTGEGYIELWSDGNFAARKSIGNDSIYLYYNDKSDLSMGWSPHNYGNNSYFQGCIYNVKMADNSLKVESSQDYLTSQKSKIQIPVFLVNDLKSINFQVKQ